MMVSDENQEYLMEMRLREQKGEKLTDDELRRAIDLLRDGRVEAMEKPKGTRTAKAKSSKAMSDEELAGLFDA